MSELDKLVDCNSWVFKGKTEMLFIPQVDLEIARLELKQLISSNEELASIRTRIAELEAFLGEYGSCEECELHRTWQPIETAPKSRSILALDKIGEWMVSVEWDEHEDCWIDYEGQLYRDNYFDYWTENLPLPKPPEEK